MNYKQLHKDADKRLKAAAQKVIDADGVRKFAREVAPKYKISGQTVINYIYGQGKDGFLKECLIDELLTLKNP